MTVTPAPDAETKTADLPRFLGADTETGGLDARINPLLSVAFVATNARLEELDGFSVMVKPPVGTRLEIVAAADQIAGKFNKRVVGYVDVYTKERFADAGNTPVISAGAAEVNGYVRFTNAEKTCWLTDPTGFPVGPDDWHRRAYELGTGETMLRTYVRQCFNVAPVVVAHNAEFDQRFVRAWMPGLFNDMHPQWVCTMRSFERYVKKMDPKARKGWKLVDLCKTAGYDLVNAHEALADTRGTVKGLRWLADNKHELCRVGQVNSGGN